MADPFSVDIATLIVQADSCAAQVAVTSALVAAAHPIDPAPARASLIDAARRADDAVIARSLAQSDVDRASRQAKAILLVVAGWRSRLLSELQSLAHQGPQWSADITTIRAALDFRANRFAGTHATLRAALPTLLGRAAAIGLVCGSLPTEAAKVITSLQEAPALVERMNAIEAAIRAAEATRQTTVEALRAARAALQAELRRIEHLWNAAQKGPLGASLPDLDLTWVRGAVGRRRSGKDSPPEDDS